MVLGHNFDCETSFAASLARGVEHTNGPTWGTLRKLFGLAGISMEHCFFTNAYMGLKAGSDPTGHFPGADDPDFVRRCRAFLVEQVRVQQPTLILTLGKEVLPVVAQLTPELAAQWSGADSLSALDARGAALVTPTRFSGVEHSVAVLALTHPALRHLNISRRHFNGMTGDSAELALLQEALTCAARAAL
jgi:uracil-DNA glycosylase